MKKHISSILLFLFVFCGCLGSYAQQLPVFTQFPSDELFFNPALAGTKRTYDIRLNFRDQWVGMPDAPITEGVSLNYRVNDNMGVAGYLYQDVTGPTQRNDYTLCYAYRLKFPDMRISFGVAGSMMQYTVTGSQITIHQQNDPAINLASTSSAITPEASAGVFMYNDRFQLGLSCDNLLTESENLYKSYPSDTNHSGVVQLVPHLYGFLSYFFSGNPDYIWQSTLFGSITSGTPMYLAYSLRVHFQDKFYVGASYAFGDALALDLGITIRHTFEVCYSYDIATSALSHYTSGSQEITLIFSANSLKKQSKHGDNDEIFLKRKYSYMF
jgi:type IX secretion system PorP/SprF family membrane protein